MNTPMSRGSEDGDFAFCAALVTLTQGQVTIHVNNFTDQPYTLNTHNEGHTLPISLS